MARTAHYTALGLASLGLLGSSLLFSAAAHGGDHYRHDRYKEVDGSDCIDSWHDRECKSKTSLDVDEWRVRGHSGWKKVKLSADVDFFQKKSDHRRSRHDDHNRNRDHNKCDEWNRKDNNNSDWKRKNDECNRNRDHNKCDNSNHKQDEWNRNRDECNRTDRPHEDKSTWTDRPHEDKSTWTDRPHEDKSTWTPKSPESSSTWTPKSPESSSTRTDRPRNVETVTETATADANRTAASDPATTASVAGGTTDTAGSDPGTVASGTAGTTDGTRGPQCDRTNPNDKTTPCSQSDSGNTYTQAGVSRGNSIKRYRNHHHDDLGEVKFQYWSDRKDEWVTFATEDIDDDGEADVTIKIKLKKHDELIVRAKYSGVEDEIKGSTSEEVEID